MPRTHYTLSRSEIIRGFGSFEGILASGKRFENAHLAAFVNSEIPLLNHAVLSGENKYSTPVRVGFILSKKKLKKLMIGTA